MQFFRTTCAAALLALCAVAACAQAGRPTGLDPLPHQLHPDEWPQPDYFTEALKLTHFQPEERSRALKLAAGVEPALLVLPVQIEAFGWTPAFTAVLGARLDHELAARRIDANRQTDLFDADGPYVRRFGDAEVAAFSAAHAKAPVLALYVGRDAEGKAFVTLTLRRGDRLVRAHRSFAETKPVAPLLDAFAANFPAMLDELGLKSGSAPAVAVSPRSCDAGDWALPDLKPGAAPAARAGRALVMGVLLPEFTRNATGSPRPRTADKLAWLAEAWVEGDALSPESALLVRPLVWSQLELDVSGVSMSRVTESDDPVLRALGRALWATPRTRTMPTAERDIAARDYVTAAAASLPPFTRAALIERGRLDEQFRQVDLCALEAELPALRRRAACADVEPTRRVQPATRAERALLEAWRIESAFKALHIAGEDRGIPEARQEVIDAMPAGVAAHPIVRMERFQSERFDGATGRFEDLVTRARRATTDFVQATVDLQRWNSMLPDDAISSGRWTRSEALRDAPPIREVSVDDNRIVRLLEVDGFASHGDPLPLRTGLAGMNFLRPGLEFPTPAAGRPMPTAIPPYLATPAALGSASAAPGVVANPYVNPNPPDPFTMGMWNPAMKNPAQIEAFFAQAPNNLISRTDLAVLRLKRGESVTEVRKFIDARPDDQRGDAAIGESHQWAMPGHAFFFAGELEAAGFYYAKVARLDTYSGSDLQARVRLRLIAGDLPGALKASRARLERYEDDFARRDIAGYEFMLGHAARARDVLAPRLPLSDQSELWAGVQVGQRIDGTSARAALAGIDKSSYGHARIRGIDIGTIHALRLMTDDRSPGADDLALLDELRARRPATDNDFALLQLLAQFKQAASEAQVDPAIVKAARQQLPRTNPEWRNPLKALYGWVAWQASGGTDKSLAPLRAAALSDDFDALLAKGAVLGLDGQPDEALRYLRAARFALIETIGEHREDLRSAPYMLAFFESRLYERTHDGRYRDEALLLAHAQERSFPFLAWPYALDALLSRAGPARDTAACRAAFLDRGSQFLALSGLKPDPHGKACRQSLW